MQAHQISIITVLVAFLGACSSQEAHFRQSDITESNKDQLKDNHRANVVSNKLTKHPEPVKLDAISHEFSAQLTPTARIKRHSGKMRAKTKHPAAMKELERKTSVLAASPSLIARRIYSHEINRYSEEDLKRENYQHFLANPIQLTSQQSVSTFSIDVDSGSYSNIRRMLHDGLLPRHDAVRVEEFINYFSYDYPAPKNTETPFNIVTEMGPSPWNKNTHLLHIGIKGYELNSDQLPAANLVFLVDVSGSMNSPDKLPLLKNALLLLTNKLRSQDSVAIVVYAGASGTVLQPTAGNQKAVITSALQNLASGGSTNGAAGITLAYQLARQSFIKNGINRIILATDGDFNVGTTNLQALKDLIAKQRQSNISLTTLGFGQGNYNDALMEQLADIGNGNYAYIDNLLEAQKSLVDQIGGTLLTIAKDVKIQIEFNPRIVQEYRLIGYENRKLKREDFNNDNVDAGDIGAGHTVTALYEISLVGSAGNRMDPLRYQSEKLSNTKHKSGEVAFLKIRYKQPGSDTSKLISQAISQSSTKTSLQNTTARYQFSASVAAFGQLLRSSDYLQNYGFKNVIKLAQNSKGHDINGYRGEFINLVKLAQSLQESTKISLR